MKKVLLFLVLVFMGVSSVNSQTQVYELRVYELTFYRSADLLHSYFEKALIPALNRQGAKNIGVFEEMGMPLPHKIYLLVPHKDILTFQESERNLFDDAEYMEAADFYLNADQATVPFTSISTSLIHSTQEFPELQVPDNAGVYELRIYESHHEGALKNKLRMFEEEFAIFDDAGLPMVFYGKNISGPQMLCLTYMLASTDLAANKAGWSNFIKHPAWKELASKAEYKGNMTEITRIFLKALDYSQI